MLASGLVSVCHPPALMALLLALQPHLPSGGFHYSIYLVLHMCISMSVHCVCECVVNCVICAWHRMRHECGHMCAWCIMFVLCHVCVCVHGI